VGDEFNTQPIKNEDLYGNEDNPLFSHIPMEENKEITGLGFPWRH